MLGSVESERSGARAVRIEYLTPSKHIEQSWIPTDIIALTDLDQHDGEEEGTPGAGSQTGSKNWHDGYFNNCPFISCVTAVGILLIMLAFIVALKVCNNSVARSRKESDGVARKGDSARPLNQQDLAEQQALLNSEKSDSVASSEVSSDGEDQYSEP